MPNTLSSATSVVDEAQRGVSAELNQLLASLDMSSLADTLPLHGVRSLEAIFALATDDSSQGKTAFKAAVDKAGWRMKLKEAALVARVNGAEANGARPEPHTACGVHVGASTPPAADGPAGSCDVEPSDSDGLHTFLAERHMLGLAPQLKASDIQTVESLLALAAGAEASRKTFRQIVPKFGWRLILEKAAQNST